ncbi:MAG: FAD-dependent monooxygenase [Butyrivibrio sp.]|nr:FAD-dependent monooxygenase [Butyrivibrio sp.]
MIRVGQIKIKNDGNTIISGDELKRLLVEKAVKRLRVKAGDVEEVLIRKHSVDARKKPELFDIYVVDILLKGNSEEKTVKTCRDKDVSIAKDVQYDFWENVKGRFDVKDIQRDKGFGADKKVVIIGSGPAGLFCGLELAKNGFKPVIIERGSDVDTRSRIVEEFWKSGKINPSTNVQFGEGGAGTFSDGKLNTVVKDRFLRGSEALDIFVKFGAPERIRYESKPHIGTDILKNVVKNIRGEIIRLGGEVVFECCATDLVPDENGHIRKVLTTKGEFDADCVVLAIGHSARDTFKMLMDREVRMEPKPFAVGFRVEHPQKLINLSQYGIEEPKALPASPYKLTATTHDGRGVYSFCMCPGGYVVNASSEEGGLAVNGMSYSARAGKNANSAIIITIDPTDYGDGAVDSGIEFQRKLEKKAYDIANGRIPVEYYGDFKEAVLRNAGEEEKSKLCGENIDLIERESFSPQMKGEYAFAPVHEILPKKLNLSFIEGMEKFGKMIQGYNSESALISGVESRTSSPVRILRNEDGESVNVAGLYPCGEGAGYAGGIMSAAMDGIRTAELIAGRVLCAR